jgi:hypothetical protein
LTGTSAKKLVGMPVWLNSAVNLKDSPRRDASDNGSEIGLTVSRKLQHGLQRLDVMEQCSFRSPRRVVGVRGVRLVHRSARKDALLCGFGLLTCIATGP